MGGLGEGSNQWQRREQSCALDACVAALAMAIAACAATPEPELPAPPDGAELVLELGELEVYKAFDGEVCAGTLRRIELHANGLAELFDMDPPRARVFLHDDIGAVDAACPRSEALLGCTQWWGAHALSVSVTHELVHVFVNAATGVRTRPAIQEGVAWALQGDWDVPGVSAQTYDEFKSLLAMRTPFGLEEVGDAHFFAWAMNRFGARAVLDAHVATARAASDDDVEAALARSFGFDTLSDLFSDYEATRAVLYPPIMDTAKVFSADELATGTVLDTSCAGAYTEGPTEGETITRVLLDVQTGEYALASTPLSLFGCPPRWRPSEPVSDWPDSTQAESCAYDQDPPHYVFHRQGHHELALDDADLLGCDVPDPAVQVALSMQYLNGEDSCTPP